MIKKATEMAKACQEKEGAVDQDIEEFFNHKVPSTDTGKCFRACFMEDLGIVS